MPDRPPMPDAVGALADLIRASALPAEAVLATRYMVGADGALPTGKSIYMLATPVSGGGDEIPGWRMAQEMQLDVTGPDPAACRAAWEQVRQFVCRRGGHPDLGGVGSIRRAVCTIYPISVPSESSALARITSSFTLSVSSRGR